MSDVDDRADRLQGFLRMDPDNVQLACEAVDALLLAGRHEGAEDVISGLPQASRSAPGLRFRSARCGLLRGRYADAADLLRAVIVEGHVNIALWHDLAFSQLCLRQTEEAKALLAQALERHGDSEELAIVRARVALMEEDFAGAHRALDVALNLSPQHATALGLRALAFLDEGRTDEAGQTAEAALAIHPDQHEALLVAGTTALWRRDLETADQHLSRALERHPNSGRALSSAGQVCMLRADLMGGRVFLERAVRAMPDHIGTWHALAWAQLLSADLAGAQTSYQSAYDLDRNFADSHGGLALIAALRGAAEEADAAIKIALRLNPQCATALYARSILLQDRGEVAAAEQLLEKLIDGALPPGTSLAEFARNLRARLSTPAA